MHKCTCAPICVVTIESLRPHNVLTLSFLILKNERKVGMPVSFVCLQGTHVGYFCSTFVATGMSNEHIDRAEQLLESSEATNANVSKAGEQLSEVTDGNINASEPERLQLLRDVHKSAAQAYHLQQLDTGVRLVYEATVLYNVVKHGESFHEQRRELGLLSMCGHSQDPVAAVQQRLASARHDASIDDPTARFVERLLRKAVEARIH